MNKIVCVIPARSGSTRLKNKNFKKINGKSLIEKTIIAAKKTKKFGEIILSSDRNLELLCKKHKIKFFLRKKYSDSKSSVSLATIFTIKKLNLDKKFKTVVQLMPSCPLRNELDIINNLKKFKKNKSSFSISCFKISWLHFFWALEKKSNRKMNFYFKKKNLNNKKKIYFPTGAIWIAEIKKLLKNNSFYHQSTDFFELNWINSIDIDIKEDFNNAKILSKINKLNG